MIFLKGGIWTASAVHTAVMRNLLSFFLGILSDLLYVFVCSALFLDRAVTFVWDAPLRRRTGAIIHALARSRAASAALIFIPCFLLPFSLLTQKGVLILAGDRPLGFVQDADMLSGTVHEIEASASAASGETYSLPFSLSTRSMRAPLCEFLDENALRTALTEQSGELDTLAVISIDGTRAGVCHNAEEAQTLLDRVKRLYTTQADSSADFVQQVHVDSVVAESRLAGEPQTVFETLSDRLDVRARRSVTYTETIPFGTVTRENDAEYQDYRETLRQGQTGEAVVTAEIQTLDGEENERTIVARTVLRSASDEIIEVGTKNIGIGTGSFDTTGDFSEKVKLVGNVDAAVVRPAVRITFGAIPLPRRSSGAGAGCTAVSIWRCLRERLSARLTTERSFLRKIPATATETISFSIMATASRLCTAIIRRCACRSEISCHRAI